MHQNADTSLPVRLSQFLSAANDENGQVRIADATIAQLVFGLRCKLDLIPGRSRGLMALLAASAVAGCAGKEVGHG